MQNMTNALTTRSAKKQAKATFGGNSKDGDVPEDLIAYIKGLM